MRDIPTEIVITEEGPREGFQFEAGPIATGDKIALIEALGETGIKNIQACSFVSPRLVPGWADAEAVMAGVTPNPEITYSALWFNETGLNRALAFRDKLTLKGAIALSASDAFSRKNLNRSQAVNLEAMKRQTALHIAAGVPVTTISVMAAFGCNYSGDVALDTVIGVLTDGLAIADDQGARISQFSLADTMGWATPPRIERVVGAVRNRWPDKAVKLHLHDTRGLGIANAYAGLRLGVAAFDAAVGGLGGCPFSGQKDAPGNIATEELVLLCDEIGIKTGIDLDALVAAGHLAERIVGHRLPSAVLRGGSLRGFRRAA